MYKIQNWKDMNSWLKFFVFFNPKFLIFLRFSFNKIKKDNFQ